MLLCVFMFAGCGDHESPDISGYTAKVDVRRFEKDFFATDTLQMELGLNKLKEQYPDFFPGFIVNVLGINPADPNAPAAIRAFIGSYASVARQAIQMGDGNLAATAQEVGKGLRYLQYYFPQFRPDSPFVITTFVGPMDAFEAFSIGDYGDVRTSNGVGIALQLHLGADAGIYEEGMRQGIFYGYQTRRFTPSTMAVNSMKNLVEDLFPYNAAGKSLVEEMVEKGKRLYLLDKLMPDTDDSLKIGYTGEQLKGCYENEASIWGFFVKNDLLYSKESSVNQLYIRDGPKTAEFGDAAPGYIGLFVGRQIVRSFMKKNAGLSLAALMEKDAAALLNEAGYKP